MGNIIKLSLILFFVAGLAAGILAFYDTVTKPKIEKIEAKGKKDAMSYVLPQGKQFKEIKFSKESSESYFKALDENGSLVGYIFVAKGPGFSGIIETMVGTDTNFKIIGIKVLKHSETPGLGAETQVIKYGDTKPFFETWFTGKNSLKVVVEKDDNTSKDKVQAITGATITTRAVCNSINKYSQIVEKLVKKGGE